MPYVVCRNGDTRLGGCRPLDRWSWGGLPCESPCTVCKRRQSVKTISSSSDGTDS